MSPIFGTFKGPLVFATLFSVLIVSLPLSVMASGAPGEFPFTLKGPAVHADLIITDDNAEGINIIFTGTCKNITIPMQPINDITISFDTIQSTEGQILKDLEVTASATVECGIKLPTVIINVHSYSDDGTMARLKVIALFKHPKP